MIDFLKDFGQLISITLIPVIIWFLGVKFQNRKAKQDAKMQLFLKLMANRQSTPISRDWVDALNQIDVVFQDNQKIRKAWRDYYDSLNPKSQHFDNQNSFQLDLLSEIANSLNYKNLKQTEIDRFYNPVAFGNQMKSNDTIAREVIRVLSRTKAVGIAFTDAEYEKHIKNSE